MQRKKAGLPEVFRLYMFAKALPKITSTLSIMHSEAMLSADPDPDRDSGSISSTIADSLQTKLLLPFKALSSKFSLYEQLVEHVLDLGQLPDLVINSKHDQELTGLREEIDGIEAEAQGLWRQARDGQGLGSVDIKLEDSLQHGFIPRSTKGDDERAIRAANPSVRIISILKVSMGSFDYIILYNYELFSFFCIVISFIKRSLL
jgi:hypothetical protein